MRFLFLSLFVMIFMFGCQSYDTKEDEAIFQWKESFVGDNSAIRSIANQLPGAEHLKGFELKTNEEPYGIILNYDWVDSEQAYEELVISNATFLFTLVQNVDWVTFKFDLAEYTITQEEIYERYGNELDDIESEDELNELIEKQEL